MPRNSSFDHGNAVGGKQKGQAAAARFSASRSPLHYGRKFAQTTELYQALEMEHELQELVRRDTGEDVSREKPLAQQGAPAPGPPIGAVPLAAMPRLGSWRDALDSASRELRALEGAGRDLAGAAVRLLRLPLAMARLTVRRLIPWGE